MHYALYIASFLGAAALLLLMPRRTPADGGASATPLKLIGAFLGMATIGGLWLWLSRRLPEDLGMQRAAFPYYYVFSFLAIAAAVRVITHGKPVYAALWFVMVVIASSGLLLVLSAEFVAFAMLIIYGGAILVTYVFVIMLASESGGAQRDEESPEYDRVAREPLFAVLFGFLVLASLLNVAFPDQPHQPNPRAAALSDAQVRARYLTDRPTEALLKKMSEADREAIAASLPNAETLENAERVGLDLFQSHPLGLELAGVILLISLIGAVLIAKQHVGPNLDSLNPDATGSVTSED